MKDFYGNTINTQSDTGWNDLYRSNDGRSYVKVRERNGVVYIMGSSGGTDGDIVIKGKVGTVVATLPHGYLPHGYKTTEVIVFAISLKGGAGNPSGTIKADGRIELYSTSDSNYWGFCISYPL